MPKERVIQCPVCGRWIVTTVKNREYCSNKCKNTARSIRDKKPVEFGECPVCHDKFQKSRSNQIYCCALHRIQYENFKRGRDGNN